MYNVRLFMTLVYAHSFRKYCDNTSLQISKCIMFFFTHVEIKQTCSIKQYKRNKNIETKALTKNIGFYNKLSKLACGIHMKKE